MTITIQKLLYEALLNQTIYPVYSRYHHSLPIPHIHLENIQVSSLPYSQELYKYDKIDAIITINDNSSSNKRCLQALDAICKILKALSLHNLCITTQVNNTKASATITVTFTHISSTL